MKKHMILGAVILNFCIPIAISAYSDSQRLSLSEHQIHTFFDQGILIIPNFFSKQEIEQVSQCADRLQAEAEKLSKKEVGKVMYKGTQFVIDRVGDNVQIHRIVLAGSAEPQLLILGRQKKLLMAVAQLLGSTRGDHIINQLHYKFPNDGVRFDWHQDIRHRRNFDPQWQDLSEQGSFVQTIVAIDPMTTENGAIFFVPQSHKRGDLSLDKIHDREEFNRIAGIEKAIPLLLNPGDIVFMHPYLVHGSEANSSSSSRRIFVNGFSFPGANKQPYPGIGSAATIDLISRQDI